MFSLYLIWLESGHKLVSLGIVAASIKNCCLIGHKILYASYLPYAIPYGLEIPEFIHNQIIDIRLFKSMYPQISAVTDVNEIMAKKIFDR